MREFLMVWLTGALCTGVILDAVSQKQQTAYVWGVALLFWPALILRLAIDQ